MTKPAVVVLAALAVVIGFLVGHAHARVHRQVVVQTRVKHGQVAVTPAEARALARIGTAPDELPDGGFLVSNTRTGLSVFWTSGGVTLWFRDYFNPKGRLVKNEAGAFP